MCAVFSNLISSFYILNEKSKSVFFFVFLWWDPCVLFFYLTNLCWLYSVNVETKNNLKS